APDPSVGLLPSSRQPYIRLDGRSDRRHGRADHPLRISHHHRLRCRTNQLRLHPYLWHTLLPLLSNHDHYSGHISRYIICFQRAQQRSKDTKRAQRSRRPHHFHSCINPRPNHLYPKILHTKYRELSDKLYRHVYLDRVSSRHRVAKDTNHYVLGMVDFLVTLCRHLYCSNFTGAHDQGVYALRVDITCYGHLSLVHRLWRNHTESSPCA